MSPTLLHLFLLFALHFAYQQLTHPTSPHIFHSADPPLHFLPSSDALCSATYASAYSLSAWVIFHVLPFASQEFFLLETNSGVSALQALQNADGSVTVNIGSCSNFPVLQIAGLPVLVWIHIGVTVNSYSHAMASAITWSGIQVIEVQQALLPFLPYDPGASRITLGGSNSVSANAEMVDARFYTSPLTASDLLFVAGAGQCRADCYSPCDGPVCYYSLVSHDATISLNADIHDLSFSYARVDSKYSFAGWFFFEETDSTGWRTLFRLTETANNIGTIGDRILLLELGKGYTPPCIHLVFDTSLSPNNDHLYYFLQ